MSRQLSRGAEPWEMAKSRKTIRSVKGKNAAELGGCLADDLPARGAGLPRRISCEGSAPRKPVTVVVKVQGIGIQVRVSYGSAANAVRA